MKKSLAVLLSSVLVFGLTACGSDSKESAGTPEAGGQEQTTTLRIYAQYSDEDTKGYYDYAAAELAKEMPNVKLELEVQAQDDGQKLKSYAATGNLPDIFNAGQDQINLFRKSNNILQLDDYAEKMKFKDNMQPSAMNTLYADDEHIYAFPYAGNEFVLIYYNKELFEQNGVAIPTTKAELLTAIEAFQAKGITPMSIFAKEKWITTALYDIFATRYDPRGIKGLDSGETKPSDEAYGKAAQDVIDLVAAGLLPKGATNLNYDQAAALFHEGKAAMFVNGQWEIEASTKALGDKAGYLYYPAPDQAMYEQNKLAFSGGGSPGGFAVSANTKHKDLAAEVASFMALKYAEFKYTQKGSPIVATKVDMEPAKAFDPMMVTLSEDIPNITSTTAFAWGLSNAKFKAAIEDASQSLLMDGYSAQQFVSDLESALK
ncbi:extracellular solute-binding protein [Paenibacillus sp. F411]|uniref:Sugar ABC transporter substrate-binding protein n=1 Tax=Paenibacillus algicola TaxID=2565926 RepID=A0A4P8XIR6_9BACL|nr:MULTISPECIES: extracellular solute-binding protein [Paenibacillus]MBO2943325.1 extracellular solute-binding protein [Paenibacillus sp. F411]QCT02113.1 sugar ABC transporter substrate-binding protein [Paenibacillus algicola]